LATVTAVSIFCKFSAFFIIINFLKFVYHNIINHKFQGINLCVYVFACVCAYVHTYFCPCIAHDFNILCYLHEQSHQNSVQFFWNFTIAILFFHI
jgi:hypothetical protein